MYLNFITDYSILVHMYLNPVSMYINLIIASFYVVKYHICFCYIAVQNITKQLTSNFQGYANLCRAHNVMLKVAADINETQRLYEASIRMQVGVCICIFVTCILYVTCHFNNY